VPIPKFTKKSGFYEKHLVSWRQQPPACTCRASYILGQVTFSVVLF